jgi:hypothetical protein
MLAGATHRLPLDLFAVDFLRFGDWSKVLVLMGFRQSAPQLRAPRNEIVL